MTECRPNGDTLFLDANDGSVGWESIPHYEHVKM